MCQIIYNMTHAWILWWPSPYIRKRKELCFLANTCTAIFLFEISQILDNSWVVYLGATCINLCACLTHLKICSLIVTSKHTCSCTIEELSSIFTNNLIPRSGAVHNLQLRRLRSIPIWSNPQLVKHDLGAWAFFWA